jgi:hypothetical protein
VIISALAIGGRGQRLSISAESVAISELGGKLAALQRSPVVDHALAMSGDGVAAEALRAGGRLKGSGLRAQGLRT